MSKLPDWHHRLNDLVVERLRTPFSWGSHDCCMFAADAVIAQTGVDPAEKWRGAYSSAADGTALVESLGGIAEIGDLTLGERIQTTLAQIGDVVVVPSGHGSESLGVCMGESALAASDDGLARVPMSDAIAAWRVG